jgi:hypothetical protein
MRILMIVVGILLVAISANWLDAARCIEDRFEGQVAARPICLPLDLSVPGTYSGRYERMYNPFHGDLLRLSIAGSPPLEETKAALGDIGGEITLKDESGQTRIKQALDATTFHQWGPAENGLIVDLPLRELGKYQLTVVVTQPAKGLAGRPHCLIGEHEACGMERLPASVLNVMGAFGLAIGTVLLSCNGALRAKPSAPNAGQPQSLPSADKPGG